MFFYTTTTATANTASTLVRTNLTHLEIIRRVRTHRPATPWTRALARRGAGVVSTMGSWGFGSTLMQATARHEAEYVPRVVLSSVRGALINEHYRR